jgi:hypothetical protein
MLETIYHIAWGYRGGILNRSFTLITLLIIAIQCWRWFSFHLRITRWRYRLHLLEQEAREEGVVTVTDPEALPPLDPYMRFWDQVPAMAIMFGLLGTFIGLTVSLSQIPVTGEVEAIQKGLSVSIPSMGTAFWTSLCGLVIAITVRMTNALMGSTFRQKVINLLMASEPQVIEALESSAFQHGRDGALLRPYGIRELLWHQNRLLNQTVARVAPQISEGISRGLGQISPDASGGGQEALIQQLHNLMGTFEMLEEQNRNTLERVSQQQEAMVQAISRELGELRRELMSHHRNLLSLLEQKQQQPSQRVDQTVGDMQTPWGGSGEPWDPNRGGKP